MKEIQRILVTGAGGFIGLNLGNHLADQGLDVIGVDVHFPNESAVDRVPRFRVMRGDFRDQELMKGSLDGADVVFHLASAHLAVNLDESEYWDINARSLPALLDLARLQGVARFIHVSSVGIYGRPDSFPANEDTACKPQSIYGQTKWEGEKIVRDFSHRNDFPVVVLRPAWVYGPGCPRTAKLYRALRERRFPLIGRCANLRHPLFIDDFLAACDLVMHHAAACGQVYVIAGESPVTSRELIDKFCRVFALPQPWLKIPYQLGQVIATTSELCFGLLRREPPFSRRTLEFFDTDNAFDISKAKCQLGYNPSYDLERGLTQTRPWLESLTSSA